MISKNPKKASIKTKKPMLIQHFSKNQKKTNKNQCQSHDFGLAIVFFLVAPPPSTIGGSLDLGNNNMLILIYYITL